MQMFMPLIVLYVCILRDVLINITTVHVTDMQCLTVFVTFQFFVTLIFCSQVGGQVEIKQIVTVKKPHYIVFLLFNPVTHSSTDIMCKT